MEYYQTAGEGGYHHFDILERTVWEPRSINYTGYSALLGADGDDAPLSFRHKKSLLDYALSGTSSSKKSLIASSQELLSSNNNRAGDPFDVDLQDTLLRANTPILFPTDGDGNTFIVGYEQNNNYEIAVGPTKYYGHNEMSGSELTDALPAPKSFLVSETLFGRNFVAYYYKTDGMAAVAAVTGKLLDRNVVYTAIDGRHLKNASVFLQGIFSDIGKDIGLPEEHLALELSAFNAIAKGKAVVLDGATMSERGISNFEIQRAIISDNFGSDYKFTDSLFSVNYNSIDTKQALGFTNNVSNYNLIDENVAYGKEYAY